MVQKNISNNGDKSEGEALVLPTCGIVMPISALDGCSESHWSDVLQIITDSIEVAGFKPNIVSNADEIGVIQKRIVQNLYENPIVVCDVSGKNPNVMFELGMRLAFDKPTIIIKDNLTNYSFDTAQIEHLQYPRDLRYSVINEFKNKLSEKITSTYRASQNDNNYTTFLKHFGDFTVAKIEQKEVSQAEYLIQEMNGVKEAISSLRRDVRFSRSLPMFEPDFEPARRSFDRSLCMLGIDMKKIEDAAQIAKNLRGIEDVQIKEFGKNHFHISYKAENPIAHRKLQSSLQDIIKMRKNDHLDHE